MRVNHHHRDDEGGVRRDVDKSANAAVEERKSFRETNATRRKGGGPKKADRRYPKRDRRRRRRRRRRLSSSREQRRERRRRQTGSTKTVTQAGTSKDYNASPSHSPSERANWFPVAFSKNVKFDHMIPFDLFNVPWVLFRTKSGKIGCVKDECAHRACPLSLGTQVEEGHVLSRVPLSLSLSGECVKLSLSLRRC